MAISLPPGPRPRTNQKVKPTRPLSASAMAQLNVQLQALGQQFLELTAAQEFAAAYQVNRQAHALLPQHPAIMGDAAFCQLRLGNYDQALDFYTKACALAPNDTNWWDGRTEASGLLGRMEDVRRYGLRALELKDTLRDQSLQAIALNGPPPSWSGQSGSHVIAFSLFGDKPRYCETALLNVQVAQQLLPQWTCRFYVDNTVPEAVRHRLQQSGAQVQCVSEADRTELSGLMWRFSVLQDPHVDRFLLRDADSLISTREVAAVQAWLRSDKWFHAMRDYFTHTELLLAGMWGGCGGVFKGVRQSMVEFIRRGHYLGQRVVDQHYLRAHIWPTVRQSLLTHDSLFGFMQSEDFPPHAPHALGDKFHVGSNFSTASIGAASDLPNGQTVRWTLLNAQAQEVCSYNTPVQSGAWRVELPHHYIEQIRTGAWRIDVSTAVDAPEPFLRSPDWPECG